MRNMCQHLCGKPTDRQVVDGKLICNALKQITVTSYDNSASREYASELKFARVHFYLKLPSMNLTETVSQCVCSEHSDRKTHVLHETSKGLEQNLRSELLVAYTESTINFKKFISVAGSFYL